MRNKNLIEVALEDAGLEERGLADEVEEAHIVVAVQGGEALDGELDSVMGPQMFTEGLHLPEGVTLVHVQQNVVGAELVLSRTGDALKTEVIVDVLQGLQALCQVFVVQLWGEIMMAFFA